LKYRLAVAQRAPRKAKQAEAYRYEEQALLRPEIGTQAQFRQRKPPKTYRYDSSLAPSLDWDSQSSARELGEWLLLQIEEASRLDPPHRFAEPRCFGDVEVIGLEGAVAQLKALSQPFLNWAGRAERLSFDVPTLPLFVHERLSTKAILQTLTAHERDRQTELQLFADPQLPLHQQLEAYEHKGGWVNRMILGDSLVVMNSLLEYEGLGGQVQMIYVDPPYGVKFGSNFQPFVRRREVKNNDDGDMTREPEMVKAYRDTWELGLHSYLTYLRDRLSVAHDLLTPSGSVFVQISDENVHHVREVLDNIFGSENFVAQIVFQTTTGFDTKTIATLGDFILWYARDKSQVRANKLFVEQPIVPGQGNARWVLLPDGSYRGVTAAERRGEKQIPDGARLYSPGDLQSQGAAREPQPFIHEGKEYRPGANAHWKANYPAGLERLANSGRIHVAENSIRYRRFARDFPFQELGNIWTDTSTGNFTEDKLYVVKTPNKAIERCILIATQPGDLVLDPTCGGGTSAHMAERWGRRWITIDTSRVPLALARQRILTATYPFFELIDDARGPSGGFIYKPRTEKHPGGAIVARTTLESIANDEPPVEEVLIDRPELYQEVTRVSGPFVVEATIPTPVGLDGERVDDMGQDGARGQDDSFVDRMLEVLRRNPVLRLSGNRQITLRNVREPTATLSLSAEAAIEPDDALVAIVFGPENGAISEKLIFEAGREAHAKSYAQLLVIGFAIEAGARELVEKAEQLIGISTTYVQATPDIVMGDLLKTMRSSQIFSVAGLPDVAIRRLGPEEAGGPERYEVELLGFDVFDPTTMEVDHSDGSNVPAWLLDTDWNELSFHVSQAFFPRTSAWDSLKRALKGEFEDSVWEHLSGTTSAPFTAGEGRKIAVKVIDDRGNELLVVKSLNEAR
jgi:adenine-specific DNA-methyltransferase